MNTEEENDPGNVKDVMPLPFDTAPPSPKQLSAAARGHGKVIGVNETPSHASQAALSRTGESQPSTLTVLGLTASDIAELDTDKLSALLSVKERMEDRDAEKAFSAALVGFRGECPKIHKGAEIRGRSTYAPWDHVDAVISPILARHGLCLTFGSPVIKDGTVRITGKLRHSGGHSETEPCEMPVDQKLSANDSQKGGSAISYAKRYLAGAMLNLSFTDEDDDAQCQGAPETVTDAQADTLRELLDQLSEGAQKRFKALYQVNVPDIPAASFAKACKQIGATIKQEGGGK